MNCRDIDELLSTGPGDHVTTPEAVDHLFKCRNCRALMVVLDEARKSADPPEDLLDRIQTKITEDLSPAQSLPPFSLLLLACATIFLVLVVLGAAPFALTGWHALGGAQRVSIFATLATGAALLSISLVGQMEPGSRRAVEPAKISIAVLATLVLVIASVFRSKEETAFLADGLRCLISGFTDSAPAALLFGLFASRGALLFPKLTGATAGGLAGLTGVTVLEINCSNPNVFHILVWHCGVIVISAGACTLVSALAEHILESRINSSNDC
jgi:hypothetical protein